MDTAQKRFSALNHTAPWRGALRLPTGASSAAARLALLFLYAGITPSAAVAGSGLALRITVSDRVTSMTTSDRTARLVPTARITSIDPAD